MRRVGLSGLDVARLMGAAGAGGVLPGHEIAGEVADLGREVHGWSVGDRVTVNRLCACGHCLYCGLGRPTLCDQRQEIGLDRDGGLAEYVVVPARNLYQLPDNADWALAASVDPLASALPAVNRASIMFEDTVVILGAGAMGLYSAQLARLAGPQRLVVLGREAARLAAAREWAAAVVDVAAEDGLAAVQRLSGGQGADVVIEASGSPASVAEAVSLAGRTGRVALLGAYAQPSPMPAGELGQRGISLYGTWGYSPDEFLQALALLMGGHVRHQPIVTHTLPLDEVEHALALMVNREAIKVHLVPA
ncbi:MAG: alcohol dehydrogenase catalytic domain-containing protein [Anaerolineae bacterium]|nr:alcohol dehydrogenase catalytic domain-containing protein [Anaerolineae bacterium]